MRETLALPRDSAPPRQPSTQNAPWARFNALMPHRELYAEFYIMRHGEAVPTKGNFIVSALDSGVLPKYGLTDDGRAEVRKSAEKALETGILTQGIVIVSSPFSRCIQTAEIVREAVRGLPIIVEDRFRERFFGEHDFTEATTGYPKVWDNDKTDPFHRQHKGESVVDVLQRATLAFVDLNEGALRGHHGARRKFLVVLHGDTGQISEMGFQRKDPKDHRSLRSLGLAEIRQMRLGIP
jgi:broad specificity phosphatase PhoE